jgi:hypothetical protein
MSTGLRGAAEIESWEPHLQHASEPQIMRLTRIPDHAHPRCVEAKYSGADLGIVFVIRSSVARIFVKAVLVQAQRLFGVERLREFSIKRGAWAWNAGREEKTETGCITFVRQIVQTLSGSFEKRVLPSTRPLLTIRPVGEGETSDGGGRPVNRNVRRPGEDSL